MKTKKLSVGIAAYNMERYLNRCVDSLLIPSIDELEVIIVNNASTDDTARITHEYAEKYPDSIKVVDIEENHHYGGAVNAALANATGTYFKLCDADDKFCRESLEDFLRFLESAQSDIVFSPYRTRESNSGAVIREVNPAERYLNRTLDIEDVEWTSPEMLPYQVMHSICVKTSILKSNEYRQTEGISYSDSEFVFYSVLFSKTCSFFALPVYEYYTGRDGQTCSTDSMIKSHMHFYINAKRMLDTYVSLPLETGNETQSFLFGVILRCIKSFIGSSLIYIRNNAEQIELYNGLVAESRESLLPCPIENRLLSEDRWFRLWKRFHIPHMVFYYLGKTKQSCSNFRARIIKN